MGLGCVFQAYFEGVSFFQEVLLSNLGLIVVLIGGYMFPVMG